MPTVGPSVAGSWCGAVARRTGACGGGAASADGDGDGDGAGGAASTVGRGALVPGFAPEAAAVGRDAGVVGEAGGDGQAVGDDG
ncbi:hypothetical protein ABZX03_37440, partial [Streptomyces sp. NPDC004538]